MQKVAHIEMEGNQFTVICFGNGPKLMVAIPGYADRKEQFLQLKEALSEGYSVYVLDLPGHGESEWTIGFFNREDFVKAIRMIMNRENQSSLSMMGHSFGGRVILSLLPDLKDSIDEIILLAPDGLDEGYFRRATFLPKSIRKTLQRFLKNPGWYVGLVGFLNRIGLLKDYSFKFVKVNFENAKRRKRLFLYWNSIDCFHLNPATTKQLLNESEIPLKIVLGKRDYVIPAAAWKDWAKSLNKVQLDEIDANHRLIGSTLNDYLKREL